MNAICRRNCEFDLCVYRLSVNYDAMLSHCSMQRAVSSGERGVRGSPPRLLRHREINSNRFPNKIPFKCWALFNCLCWYSIILFQMLSINRQSQRSIYIYMYIYMVYTCLFCTDLNLLKTDWTAFCHALTINCEIKLKLKLKSQLIYDKIIKVLQIQFTRITDDLQNAESCINRTRDSSESLFNFELVIYTYLLYSFTWFFLIYPLTHTLKTRTLLQFRNQSLTGNCDRILALFIPNQFRLTLNKFYSICLQYSQKKQPT